MNDREAGVSGEPAIMYLRSLQEQHFRGPGDRFSGFALPGDHPDRADMQEKWNAEWSKMLRDRPTDLQDPASYMILSFATAAISRTAQLPPFRMSDAQMPVYGSVASGVLNACVVQVDDASRPLMMFEEGLLGFKHLALNSLIAGLPTTEFQGQTLCDTDHEHAAAYLSVNTKPIQNTVELFEAYVVRGSPWRVNSADMALPDFARWAQATPVSFAMTLFIVGHEWGHLLLGHLDRPGWRPSPDEADETPPDHWDEYMADGAGCRLAVDSMIAEGAVVPGATLASICCAVLGAQLFFAYLDTIERSVSILCTGQDSPLRSKTHPPARRRLSFVQEWLRRSAPEETATHVQGYVDHWLRTAQLHFDAVLQRMRENRAKGVPSAISFDGA